MSTFAIFEIFINKGINKNNIIKKSKYYYETVNFKRNHKKSSKIFCK